MTGRVDTDDVGQPLGVAVAGWTPRPAPTAAMLEGRYCRLERLDPGRHADQLFAADRADLDGRSWTYLPYGPFTEAGSYRRWVEEVAPRADPRFYAVVDTDPLGAGDTRGCALGVAAYLRIQAEVGSIEVGHIHYSPALQRSRGATEAQYLLMRHVFDDLGYRRYEWKCNDLNASSRRAAARLGFTYEGTFRQAAVVKGRNRDTAWYSIIDEDWPPLRRTLETWLDPANFDEHGGQLSRLAHA